MTKIQKNIFKLFALFFLALSVSCSYKTPVSERRDNADKIAKAAALKKEIIKTDSFQIVTYSKIDKKTSSELSVYIEGDGYSWKNRYTVSDNPTPINPVALKLAASDENKNILYIARPCQYIDLNIDENCSARFWSNSMLSQVVVESLNDVIDRFKEKYGFKSIRLYGYSGGGGLAVIMASQRKDVKVIATVAANLAVKQLADKKGNSIMDDSYDPIDYANLVKHIPQFHLVGLKDTVVPPDITYLFVKKVNDLGGGAKFIQFDKPNHEYGEWDKVWSRLLEKKHF